MEVYVQINGICHLERSLEVVYVGDVHKDEVSTNQQPSRNNQQARLKQIRAGPTNNEQPSTNNQKAGRDAVF